MVILKFLKKVSAELLGETTMKPIPYRELDLQMRARPNRVSYRRLAFGGGRGQQRLGFMASSPA